MTKTLAQSLSSAVYISLILLTVAWEGYWAPLRPEGSWLILKGLPLLLPLMGVLNGRIRSLQWASLVSLLYLTEGLVRAWSDTGMQAILAGWQAGLVTAFIMLVWYQLKRARS